MTRSARHRRSVPLARLLLISIGTLVVLVGGSVLFVLRSTSEHLLHAAGTRSLLRTMDVIETIVRSHLDPARFQVESLADLLTSEDFDLSDTELIATTLQGALASTPQIRVLVFSDANLQFVAAVKDAQDGSISIEQHDNREEELARSMDEVMQTASTAQWGELIAVESIDRTILNVRYPVRRDGKYLGFLAAGVTKREMSKVAVSIENLMGVTTYLSLGDRQIIAHPDLVEDNGSQAVADLFRQIKATKTLDSIETIRDPDSEDDAIDEPFELGQVEAFHFQYANKSQVGFTRALNEYGNPPLVIGSYCAEEILVAPMRLLYQAAAIAFILLVIALGVAVWLSRAISRPIQRVSAGVTQIGQFSLQDVKPMAASPIREVDDLASSFNRMLGAIHSFSTYIPQKLAAMVVQGKAGASVESEERELTVMFTDIAGFTTLSEGMDAVSVAEFINEHLTMLAECVEGTGGTIDKYIGDALMAFWGAPERMENSAEAACRAAQLMAERIRQDNQQRISHGQVAVRLRIGIHTGPLVVGNIGAPGRINYTVVGDTVNIAQRLESLGKQIDAEAEVIVLLSETTAENAQVGFNLHQEGDFQLRGKQQDIGVYRLQ